MCEQVARTSTTSPEWETRDRQKAAIRAATGVSVWVYSRDGAHRVRISKTEAARLFRASPDGWTVVHCGGRRVLLEERGTVTADPFRTI